MNFPGEKPWDLELSMKVVSVCVLIICAGVGNIFVILSVILNKSMRSRINIYLVNLSIADLLITIWCPLNRSMVFEMK